MHSVFKGLINMWIGSLWLLVVSYTSFSALFATVRDVVIVCCLFLWIFLSRQECCLGVSAAFCGSSGVFFLYKYLLLGLSTCRLLWFSLNSKHTRANVMLVKIVYDCACRLYSKYALREMVSFSTCLMIRLQNVNHRIKMLYLQCFENIISVFLQNF